jgi:LacI family transcriptional regulator
MHSSPLNRRATARDVAERVGCSIATVSLYINGKAAGRVAVATQQRIEKAIAELGYRVNTTASALATGGSNAIGFVSPDPTNPFFSMVLEGLTTGLDDRFALTVLMPSHGNDYDRPTLQRALAGDFAGLVLASPGRYLLDAFSPTCPTILLDAGGSQAGFNSIDIDITTAANELAEHLVGLGHQEIGYVRLSRDKASLRHRQEYLDQALARVGASLGTDHLVLDDITVKAAELAFPEVWETWKVRGVTAVICGDELYAYGVLKACKALGFSVPGDLSLVAFNDLPYAELMDPPLTSINLSARGLGTAAAAALQRYIETGRRPARQTVPASLVVRASTGRAASR